MANFPLGGPLNQNPVAVYLLSILAPGPNLAPGVGAIVPARYVPNSKRVRLGIQSYADYLRKNLIGGDVRFSFRNVSGGPFHGKQHDIYVPKSQIKRDKSIPPDMVILSGPAVHRTCTLLAPPLGPYLDVTKGGCYP